MWMHGPLKPRSHAFSSVPAAITLVLGMNAAKDAM
jgi:hypothetical protein